MGRITTILMHAIEVIGFAVYFSVAMTTFIPATAYAVFKVIQANSNGYHPYN